jgi:hypothetical protein
LEAVEDAPEPMLLQAVTVKVYALPVIRPVTVMGLPAAVAVMPPGDEVTI